MKHLIVIFCCWISLAALAQNDRVTDHNSIAWLQSFATIKLTNKFDGLAEVQWRRTNALKDPQQILLRTALQYKLNNQVSLAAGYAWIETHPYGSFPIAANGIFPERRLHQQVILKQSFNKLGISQRLRTEQRWIGRIAAGDPGKVEDWVFSNRFRYHLRLQRPLTDSASIPLYAAVANEVLINAGKNIGVNIFDQNRLQALLGIKLTPHFSLEGGYIKQTILQGRRTASNRTVIQNNDGVTLAVMLQL